MKQRSRAFASINHSCYRRLPRTLSADGVPTAVLEPIIPSGIWEASSAGISDEVPCDLLIHAGPWQSALDDKSLTKALLTQDVEAGHAFIVEGGEAAARSK